MNIKPRATLSTVLVVLTAIGCTETKPSKPSAIERAASTKSTLTSTVAATKPEPAPTRPPEEPALELVQTPPPKEERSFEPELRSMAGLSIQRLVTSSKIEGREPVAASSVLRQDDERVYAFVEVRNESEDAQALMAYFIGPDGQLSGGIELRIPAAVPRWRTWAYTRHAKKPGLWHVEIRGVDGTLLGALAFEVESSE